MYFRYEKSKKMEQCKNLRYKEGWADVKMWNASRFCVSSLRRGHANLLCIVPILVYVLPRQVHMMLENYRYSPPPPKHFYKKNISYMTGAFSTKRFWSNCIGRADYNRPLINAVSLLIDTEAFGCWVTPLARCASP